ncbi:MAG: membrane protein insertion efficiency factor YidD [SAR202 cluster bacterium]|nr:membrane protein insertion efficiency factor YidD [SAR202 cluster bacterium]
MKRFAIGIIRFYQLVVSPYLPTECTYIPSCSTYTSEAIERYGLVQGIRLSARRLSQCHPWKKGITYDPVP